MGRTLWTPWLCVLLACRSGVQLASAPCDGVPCSGHGVCGVTVAGEAHCVCDPGFENAGATTCIATAVDAGGASDGGGVVDSGSLADASPADGTGAPDVGAADTGSADASTVVPTPVALDLSGPGELVTDQCAAYRTIALADDGTPATAVSDIRVRLSGEGFGRFYADSDCATAPISTLNVAAGTSSAHLFYRSPEADQVVLLAQADGLEGASLQVRVVASLELSQELPGQGRGQLWYVPRGPTLLFRFAASGLAPQTAYTLIYFPNHSTAPTSGTGLFCLASGSSDETGELALVEGAASYLSIELDADLPAPMDDRFYDRAGADIVLTRSADVDCEPPAGMPRQMSAWSPALYLLAEQPLRYNDTGVSYLVAKDATWAPIQDSYLGQVTFDEEGASFDFSATFARLAAGVDYTLLYYHDPWPGTELSCLASGVADTGGALQLSGQLLAAALPSLSDPNYSYAKLWLARSANVDCVAPRVLSLDVANTVFDYGDGLSYTQPLATHRDVAGMDGDVVSGLRCRQSGAAWQSVPLPEAMAEPFTFWVTVKPSATTADAVVGLAPGEVGSAVDLAAAVQFASTGRVLVLDGEGHLFDAAVTLDYTVGVKGIYRLRFDVDLAAGQYSVSVLPGTDSSIWVDLASGYVLGALASDFESLGFVAFSSPGGEPLTLCGAVLR